MNKNINTQEAHKIFRQKKRDMFKLKLEQMESAYNNNNNNKDIAKWLMLLKEKFQEECLGEFIYMETGVSQIRN
jgi:hypothetical protein